jgi:tetratricopeptide (TPR) repeat protein
MVWTRGSSLAAAVIVCLASFAAPVRAAEDDAELRRRALALNNVTGEDPIKGEIKALVEDPAGTKKLLATAVAMAKGKDQPFNYNGAYILAQAAHELRDLEAGRTFYRLCVDMAIKLASGTKLNQSYGGLIDLLTRHGQFEETVKVCREFLELPDEGGNMREVRRLKSSVLRRMILSLAKQGRAEEANKLVDSLIAAQPDRWAVLLLKADVQQEAGEYPDAAKLYEQTIERVRKDKELSKEESEGITDELRYKLSHVYVEMNKIDKAGEHLKALLEREPDNATYNNDLGYIWADHDMNLDEAERMIRKAIDEDRKLRKKLKAADPTLGAELDKDNAAYLDSLGWVLFKQKKYPDAKKYLLEAVESEDGQHVEILDHLGDVHLALGEKDKAIAVWKKAVELEVQSRREKQRKSEVEKKLKEHE